MQMITFYSNYCQSALKLIIYRTIYIKVLVSFTTIQTQIVNRNSSIASIGTRNRKSYIHDIYPKLQQL